MSSMLVFWFSKFIYGFCITEAGEGYCILPFIMTATELFTLPSYWIESMLLGSC